MAMQLVQIIYWLSLSTWFGGTLFIAIAAPIIFRTVREADPVLPKVLSVNLESQHATLLAGSIVANILQLLTRVQVGCAAGLLVAIGAQWFLQPDSKIVLFVRSMLFITATILLVYQWRFLWPRIDRYRQEYLDNADSPEIANPAKEQFDKYHHESVNVLSLQLFVLVGMIFFSPVAHQIIQIL